MKSIRIIVKYNKKDLELSKEFLIYREIVINAIKRGEAEQKVSVKVVERDGNVTDTCVINVEFNILEEIVFYFRMTNLLAIVQEYWPNAKGKYNEIKINWCSNQT